MIDQSTLPAGFSALEPFVSRWAADTLAARDGRRLDSTPDERLAFYAAARDLTGSAFDYLNARSLHEYADEDRRLLNLMLSLIHVALAVELQRDGETDHARGARRMQIVHCHADPA